jgi:hypothetical protein
MPPPLCVFSLVRGPWSWLRRRREDDLPELVAAVVDGNHLGGVAAAGLAGVFHFGGKVSSLAIALF